MGSDTLTDERLQSAATASAEWERVSVRVAARRRKRAGRFQTSLLVHQGEGACGRGLWAGPTATASTATGAKGDFSFLTLSLINSERNVVHLHRRPNRICHFQCFRYLFERLRYWRRVLGNNEAPHA